MSAPDLSSLSLSAKLELLKMTQQYETLLANLGVEMYRPHTKQDKFHRLGHMKFRYLRTGNRFGKSDCGSAEDIAWALGERPWYSKDDPARYAGIKQKANRILLLCTDWGKAEEVFTSETEGKTQGKLWKWLPKAAFVRRDTNHSGNINKIVVKSIWGGESVIYIDTVAAWKMNSLRGESNWYDAIHVDEPIPEEMWNSFSRGLMDTDGSAWFTCTPLREPWINRFFIPSSRIVLNDADANYFPDKEGNTNRVVLVGTSFDNPYLPPEGVKAYMAGLSDRERAARLFGRPIDQAGTVHWPFEDTHVYYECPYGWTDINKPPLDYTIRVHIDFHINTPYAVLFSATAPSGKVYFYDEIFEQLSTPTLADMILDRTKNYFCPTIWLDPSGFVPSMRTESTFADDLAVYGIICEKASKDLVRGIKMTNDALLKPNYLHFGSHLLRTLFEFEAYVLQDPNKRPDKPEDKNDHMMEGLHRIILGGVDYIDTQIFEVNASKVRAHPLLSIR